MEQKQNGMENGSMSFYEKNKEVMEERYSEIIERIQTEISSEYQVKSIVARDGNHALVVEKDGETYRLNSAYRPLSEAKKWADQYEFQNIDINIFMFGFGNGIFVRELLRRAHKDANIFLWEPDASIFHVVVEEEDLSDIFADERLQFYIGKDGLMELKEALSYSVGWHNISTQIRCSHICYNKLYGDEYNQFFDALDYTNSMVKVKRDTNVHFAHTAVTNVIENLRYIRKSNFITEFIGKIPEGVPAIVVAAGPSLDKNIELLRKAKGKSLIIATDTAVKILEAKKIPYDCMVTIDPAKPTWYLADYPGCKDVPLFCNAESEKDILKFHTGRKIWMAGSVYIDNLYNSLGLLFPQNNTGGSVATAGAMVAYHLGLKNIILIGQDLAYTGEHTHAGGYDNHVMNEEKFIEMVDGIDGGKVKTRGDWIVYRDWFEEFIKEHDNVTVIDATEGGALIHGSKVMTFQKAIDTYCDGKEFLIDQFMEQLPATFDTLDYSIVQEQILAMEKGFANILYKSKEGKKSAEEFLEAGNKLSAKKHDRLLKEIRKANNFIERQAGYELLDMYTFELTLSELRDVNQITGNPIVDEQNSVKSALAIYDGFICAVEELSDTLKEALQEV